jgi:hypothetical protein
MVAKNEKNTFEWFCEHVQNRCEKEAKAKGYNVTGVEGKNELLQFVDSAIAPNHSHALGEIIYKTIRYKNKRNKDDLVKIAAWAYLLWKHDETGD